MASNRPLAYESLKTVISYVEPNTRFHMLIRIPAIRNTEKIIPLRIDNLEFGDNEFKVNGTSYSLGIVLTKPGGKHVPKSIKKKNRAGGVKDDVDAHGNYVRNFGDKRKRSQGQSYKRLFQWTITPPFGGSVFQRLPYKMGISAAMEKIVKIYFGNRKSIEIGGDFGLEELRMVSSLASYSKKFVMQYSDMWLMVIIMLNRNRDVHVRNTDFTADKLLAFARQDFGHSRVGQKCTLGIDDEEEVEEFLEFLEQSGEEVGERQFILPGTSSFFKSKIRITCIPTPDSPHSSWIIEYESLAL